MKITLKTAKETAQTATLAKYGNRYTTIYPFSAVSYKHFIAVTLRAYKEDDQQPDIICVYVDDCQGAHYFRIYSCVEVEH